MIYHKDIGFLPACQWGLAFLAALRLCPGGKGKKLLCGLQNTLGDLNRVKRVVKVLGFVASADGFYDQPKVIDGASCLLSEIFGEAGVGARSAVGVYSLPGNIPVEVEMLLELHPAD